jgi:hypothetical protein
MWKAIHNGMAHCGTSYSVRTATQTGQRVRGFCSSHRDSNGQSAFSVITEYGYRTGQISVACNEDHVVVSIETLQAKEFDATT